jgi:uncharacterized membrane protein
MAIDLSPTHVHLLLNHFPTIGFIMGLTLYVAGLYARSDHVKQAALVVFVGVALITIPTYCTGNAAAERLCVPARDNPTICADTEMSRTLIEMHEGAAYLSLAFMIITGGFAWLGLWQYRRIFHIARWNTVLILVFSIVTLTLVSRAANIGGEIRHPEIRLTQDLAPGDTMPLGRLVGNFIRDTPWTWVTAETLHFVGLSLLIGVLLLINARTLGIIKTVPFGALDRLLPWAVLGFGLNIVTGMLFFAAAPQQYTKNPAFYWKLVFVIAAGFNTLYFFFDKGWAVEPGHETRPVSRLVAASALFFWVGVMYWGSMLPFIGNAF